MTLKHQCDICGRLFPYGQQLNVISFYERNGYSVCDGLAKANPRFEVCDTCFSFLKEVVRQAQTVTIDDIEKEA